MNIPLEIGSVRASVSAVNDLCWTYTPPPSSPCAARKHVLHRWRTRKPFHLLKTADNVLACVCFKLIENHLCSWDDEQSVGEIQISSSLYVSSALPPG